MPRKPRSDIRIGSLEKKLGLISGSIKNPDGTDARSDKKLSTLQKESAKIKKVKVLKKNTKSTKKKIIKNKAEKKVIPKPTTADQKKASKRKVKSNPKTTSKLAKRVSSAIKKSTRK